MKVNKLTVKNLDETLIENFSVNFEVGQFWAVLGKNGIGKTTLLNTLAGFKPYQKGSIEITNKELKSYNSLLRAQQISYLPQLNEASLNCSVEQSISYGRYPWHKDADEKKSEEEIISAAICQMGLGKIRKKKVQEISGGELRKVEIATVLAQNSQVMLLDEPLNHLDLSFRFKLMQLLKDLSKNKIIIMVTHDIQYVQEYCSHAIMLFEDRETLSGNISTVMTETNTNKMLGMPLPKGFLKKNYE